MAGIPRQVLEVERLAFEPEQKSADEAREMALEIAGYGGFSVELRATDGATVMIPVPAAAFHDSANRREIGDLLYQGWRQVTDAVKAQQS